jgi:plasmid stabilization system protein ParE
MAYKVIVRDLAKEDTQAAYDHYEDERQGLGEEFLEELLKKFDDLASKPHNYDRGQRGCVLSAWHLPPSKKKTEKDITPRTETSS